MYIDTALCIGFLAGVFFISFFIALLDKISIKKFKTYYLECDITRRDDIDEALKDMLNSSMHLANHTNTNYFKKLYNGLNDLSSYIRRKTLN